MPKYKLNGPWVYDRSYEKGEIVDIPSVLAQDLLKRFPGCMERVQDTKSARAAEQETPKKNEELG